MAANCSCGVILLCVFRSHFLFVVCQFAFPAALWLWAALSVTVTVTGARSSGSPSSSSSRCSAVEAHEGGCRLASGGGVVLVAGAAKVDLAARGRQRVMGARRCRAGAGGHCACAGHHCAPTGAGRSNC